MRVAIIGSGLAGTCLAARFVTAGDKVVLFDNGEKYAASRVAAGMFNTITGYRAVKTWLADTLVQALLTFAHEVNAPKALNYIYQTPIYRPFSTIFELNEWMAASAEPTHQNNIQVYDSPVSLSGIRNPLGGLAVIQGGWINVTGFLECIQRYLVETGRLILTPTSTFDYHQLNPETGHYQADQFDAIIFCEGVGVLNNPFFSNLPIIPLKGVLLTVKIPNFTILPFTISKNHYLVEQMPKTFVFGSTYTRGDLDPTPSQADTQTLSRGLEALFETPPTYSVIEAKGGIRPTTPDRRPIVGQHHTWPKLFCFNGLGTKGVLQSPYFSKLLFNFIKHQQPLPKEVSLYRFKPRHQIGFGLKGL